MRGRIAGLFSHRSSFLRILTQSPSSNTAVPPFAALSRVTPSEFSGEADFVPDALTPLRKPSGEQGLGFRVLLCENNSFAPPGPSNYHQDLCSVRSTLPSSHCDGRLAPPFSTRTAALRIRGFASVSEERADRCCWSCEHESSTGNGLFCPSCNAIQPLDPTVDFFQIFSIDRGFKVDLKELEQSYKSLQKRLHPDLAGSKSEREREHSAEQSAHVIQAYYILIRPLSRARYLLGLHGIKVEEEGTIEDPELLMEIMEIRESIDEMSDAKALKDAQDANRDRILNCEKELESSFSDGDFQRATSWTQRLAYYIKVGEEILRKQ